MHLPMYVSAGDMGYRLAGMAVDGPMKVGMALILVGLVATCYGLLIAALVWTRQRSTRGWAKQQVAFMILLWIILAVALALPMPLEHLFDLGHRRIAGPGAALRSLDSRDLVPGTCFEYLCAAF